MKSTIINNDSRITLLFLSWRDIKSPKHGGAEVFTHEMLKQADHSKFRIIHFSPMFEGASEDENIDGVRYIRKGTVISVIFEAAKFYGANKNRINYVVDQCNTHRFFTKFWVPKEKRIFFIHQLTREIWYHQSGFPVNIIGSMTESALLGLNKKDPTMTVSPSTKQDLVDAGFSENTVTILPEGLDFNAWPESSFEPKEKDPTFIYVGRYSHYKGIHHAIEAFGKIKETYPNAKFWVVGKKNKSYCHKVLEPLCVEYNLSFGPPEAQADVTCWGFVSEEKKLELMSRAHAMVFPSIREGWGLIITEAAAVGTPSIVYNAPGTRDAVDFGNAGFMCRENTPESLASMMKESIENQTSYEDMKQKAHNFAKGFNWKNTAKAFNNFVLKLSQSQTVPAAAAPSAVSSNDQEAIYV